MRPKLVLPAGISPANAVLSFVAALGAVGL